VGRLRATGRDQLRPLTGLASATPVIADDGRVYFLSGRVSGFAGTSETLVFAASANVWSMTADGEDLRRETTALESDSLRLDAVLPAGGGYLVHRGTNPAQVVVGKSGPIDLPTNAGLVERMQVSPDRRFGLGFAGANLVRLDLARTARSRTRSSARLRDWGDAWFHAPPRSRGSPPQTDIGRALRLRSAASLVHGDGGIPTSCAPGTPTPKRSDSSLAPAQWSPSGDRVLTVESLAAGASAFSSSPDRTRWHGPPSYGVLSRTDRDVTARRPAVAVVTHRPRLVIHRSSRVTSTFRSSPRPPGRWAQRSRAARRTGRAGILS
jgi:hypothetical protein